VPGLQSDLPGTRATVLVQREMESGRFVPPKRSSGWQKQQRLKLQLVLERRSAAIPKLIFLHDHVAGLQFPKP